MTTESVVTDLTTSDFGEVTTEYTIYSTTAEDVPTTEIIYNVSSVEQYSNNTFQVDRYPVFEAFNILELIMTSLEMMVWIIAAIKMPRWRKNYRNQMLMQISLARFIKRVVFTFMFLKEYHKIPCSPRVDAVLGSSQIYIDFVIVILVFFFIKHMYDSLIIVLVKVRQNSLYKVSLCSWLVPVPISLLWTLVIGLKALDKQMVYLLICCIFRWPLIFIGTAVYITVLYRVMSEKIRRFASSLTLVTFLMCLVINFYLLTKDVVTLWCMHSFLTLFVSYLSGLIMNFLILTFFIILISLEYKHCHQTASQAFNSIPNYSLADTSCKI